MSRNDENLANVLCNYFGSQQEETSEKEYKHQLENSVKITRYYDFG